MTDTAPAAATFTIRRAHADDAPGIQRCLSSAFADLYDRYTPHAFDDTVPSVETVRDRVAKMLVLVAAATEHPSRIIGTLAALIRRGDHAHLRGMAVDPEAQGRGVATMLLHAIEAELRACGVERITLGVTAPLLRARLLYEANGFTRTGHVSSFFGMALFEYEKNLKTRDESPTMPR
jgi:ribosomal protein S18 acetylase RimI-like enzyme